MEQLETKARASVRAYTASLFIVLASFAFLATVPFVPDPPTLPLLIGLGLGAVSLRNRGVSVTVLYLLVFFAILWQMIGFGFFQLLRAGVGAAVLAVMVLPLAAFASRRVELTSMPIAVLCVSLMFTPAYFVSVPLIAAAATVTGFASLEAVSATFIMFLAPFLMLENALYFVTSSNATSPIIFGQLVNLSTNFRPPLPGLNVFLTSLPSNLVSLRAREVSEFLAGHWELLVIPLVLMGAVIVAASVAGSLVRSRLDRFAELREWEALKRVWSPIVVSLIIPAVFVLLIVPLSLPGSGGFQTSLTNDASHVQVAFMLGASALLGGAFVARESLVRRLEGVEVGHDKVLNLIRVGRAGIEQFRNELRAVRKRVPSLSLGSEEMVLSEYTSYLADVDRQVGTASSESYLQWASHIEGYIIPRLNSAEETLTNGVLNDLRALSGVVATVNSNLAQAGVPLRYSPIPIEPGRDTLENVINLYASSTERIGEETRALFESYRSTIDSFNTVMELHDASIPIGPASLLDSHEYVTAMRLVSEEYWLSFHLRYSEELENKKNALLEQLARLNEFLTTGQKASLKEMVLVVAKAIPADSTSLVKKTEEVHSLLLSIISSLGSGPQLVEKILHSLDPGAARILVFHTTRQLDEMLALKRELEATGVGLDSHTKFIKRALPVLATQAAAWKSDQENLVLAAHYHTARQVIDKMLAKQTNLKTKELPYERRTAEVYARLYASENPNVTYDEKEEELVRSA